MWATRERLWVDRMASAWLIRRFVDREARFKFVAPRGYRPKPGEIRFDMYDAEFSHDGARCTFETLVAHFRLRARGLRAIAEVVHDLDCKDGKFARPEAVGIGAAVDGIARSPGSDRARLAAAARLFDRLYVELGRAR